MHLLLLQAVALYWALITADAVSAADRLCDLALSKSKSSLVCDVANPLLEGLKNESLLCTEYHGSLTISEACLKPVIVMSMQQMTLEQFYIVFSRLKVFRGDMNVIFNENESNITSLSFLARLERIEGLPGHDTRKTGYIYISARNLHFLGLGSLRYIEKFVGLHPGSMPQGSNISICTGFLPKAAAFNETVIEYGQRGKSNKKPVRLRGQFETASNGGLYTHNCPYQPDQCDDGCESRFGCWGPGPTNCVRCRSVKAGSVCADTCGSVPGWFDGGNATAAGQTSPGSERLCSCRDGFYSDHVTRTCHPCNSTCSTCSGPGERDCLRCVASKYALLIDANVGADSKNLTSMTGTLSCVDVCPEERPHAVASQRGLACSESPGVKYAVNSEAATFMRTVIALVVAGLAIVVIVSIVIVSVRCYLRRRRRSSKSWEKLAQELACQSHVL